MTRGLAIVGGCHAGVQAAAAAREAGYAEPITLVTDDPEPPYQRPPLSKGFLLGKVDEPSLADDFEGILDVLGGAHIEQFRRNAECLSRRLAGLPIRRRAWIAHVLHEANAPDRRGRLLQELDALGAEFLHKCAPRSPLKPRRTWG